MGNENSPPQRAHCEVGTIYANTASLCISRECPGDQERPLNEASSESNSLSWLEANDLERLTTVEHKLDNNFMRRMDPYNIAHERILNWPYLRRGLETSLYPHDDVRAVGLPNCLSSKIPLKSSLKVENWAAMARHAQIDDVFIQMLKYGFPLQFIGERVPTHFQDNHASALNFQNHIEQYLQKETSELAMLGPLNEHPFQGSNYSSPMMTRPKQGSQKRRVIVDLSYPEGQGINSQVIKGYVFGVKYDHTLPTIQHAVKVAQKFNF